MERLTLLLAAMLPVACWSQPQAPSDAQPGSIRGIVVGQSQDPLRKAEVTLRAAGRSGAPRLPGLPPRGTSAGDVRVVTTDASGTFSFDELRPGSYFLSVQRNGYVRTEYGARPGSRSAGTSIALVSGQTISGVTVRMTPHGVVTGRVTDEDGDPIASASVQVLRERWISGRRRLTPMNADATNDLGEYRIAGLMPGRYYVMVNVNRPVPTASARRRDNEQGDQSYAALYYPGVLDSSQATPVTVSSGQELRGLDLQMRRVLTYRVRGTVLDESGKPSLGVSVMATPSDGGFTRVRSVGSVRNSDGSFELAGMRPGAWTLIVNRAMRQQGRSMGRQEIQVGNRDLEGVVVQLQPAFEISGMLRVAGDAPVDLTTVRVGVESLDADMPFPASGQSRTDPDGTWKIPSLAPGTYRIGLYSPPPGTYVKAVTAGGQDITAGTSITSAASGIEVVLGTDAPQVSGAVLNAEKEGIPDAVVVLVPDEPRRNRHWLYRTATTDQNGSFLLSGVPTGTWTAWAFTGVEDGIWHSPEFLLQIQGKGVVIKLEEGSREAIQLTPAQ